MKRFLVAAILLCSVGLAHAEKRFMVLASSNSTPFPQPSQWFSEAIYYTSATCGASTLQAVIISTTPAYLFAIHVTSPGLIVPFVEAFDGSTSTTSARRISAPIDATRTGSFHFNVATSSGLGVSVQGTPAPCVNVIYTER